jgi:hypothetical protein
MVCAERRSLGREADLLAAYKVEVVVVSTVSADTTNRDVNIGFEWPPHHLSHQARLVAQADIA